jgi:hypothetical protein
VADVVSTRERLLRRHPAAGCCRIADLLVVRVLW